MIRKNTWIVLAVFVVLLAAVLYLQRTKGTLKLVEEEVTPSATFAPLLLANVPAQDVVSIEWTGDGQTASLTKATDGSWALNSGSSSPADASMVDQLRASLFSLRPASQLGADNPLDAIGLSVPTQVIILKTAAGQQTQINLGSVTPTGSGYYAQVDDAAPVVVDKYEMDAVLGQLAPSIWVTPTPLPATPTLPATATP